MLLPFPRSSLLAASLTFASLPACSDAEEARRVTVPVLTDGAGLTPVTNDLGYSVELTSATIAVEDLKLTIAGEAHVSLLRRWSDAVVPLAHAHPGHYQGGEVTGELLGRFLLRFVPGETTVLGDATLLVGKYRSADMTLARATDEDVGASDPLLGHTALLSGTASRDDQELDFLLIVDSPSGRELVGIPFEHEVKEGGPALVLRLLTRDPLEQDTLFDGIDFALLDVDADGEVVVEPAATDAPTVAAYNRFRRTLQTHDHFRVETQQRPWMR